MKILSITAQKPHSTGSGVYLTELVRAFHKMGHEQMVIAGVYKEDIVEFPEDITFIPVYFKTEELPYPIAGMSDEMPYESTRYRDMTEEMGQQFEEVFGEAVKSTVSGFCPDIIICHHLYELTALVRRLCPVNKVFGVCHGSDLRQIKKNPRKREKIIESIRQLDGIFALHEVQRREIIELFRINADRVHIIGTGYNSDIFYMDKTVEAVKGRLLFAGKLSEKKGVMSLLKSFSYMEDTRGLSLILAGGSGNEAERKEIDRLAQNCPVPVEMPGRISQCELADKMRSSEVFILPSFYEGLPLVVIEALACGQKVVCTDLPGIQDWVDGQIQNHGIVFVEPPVMYHEDEPAEAELPKFEKRLSEAVSRAINKRYESPERLEEISWEGICKKILEWA